MAPTQKIEIREEFVEKLFVHIYCDLGLRMEIQDDFRIYHQLNMARLIRQLVLDGGGVFSMANRYHRLKLKFIIPTIGRDLSEVDYGLYKDRIPDLGNLPPGYHLKVMSLDEYLEYSPMRLSERIFTVKEIVKYVANVYGGVHLSPTLEDEDDILLARFNETLMVGDDGVVLNQINKIARQVLRALAPLREAIETKYEEK